MESPKALSVVYTTHLRERTNAMGFAVALKSTPLMLGHSLQQAKSQHGVKVRKIN